MAKGKKSAKEKTPTAKESPKESPKDSPKESPEESPRESPKEDAVNAQSSSAKDEKKKKKSSSSTSSSRACIPPPASPPHPIKSAPPSANTLLSLLKRKDPKEKPGDKSDSESESASQSSEEAVISTELHDEKGNKKIVQVNLDTSPKGTSSESKDAEMQVEDEDGRSQAPTPSPDFLEGFGESPLFSEGGEGPFKDLSSQIKYSGDKTLFFQWMNASDFPKLEPMEISQSDLEEYIERVLANSHKWTDTKGVRLTLDEINEADRIIRVNDEYIRSLYLRLGKALEPHTATAKEHAASMKEALNTWQQHAINVISEAVKSVQSENKNNIKEIKNEAQKSATDLKKQLDAMNKKYIELQTEHNFARAEQALKEQINAGHETTANSSKITELTLELGEQRKINEDLKLRLNTLLVDFTQYRAGHLKSSLVRDVERKKEDDRSMPPPSKKDRSPSWGKTRRDATPSSSDWDSKGDSSASCSGMDNGWGNYSQKSKVRTRPSPPRDD